MKLRYFRWVLLLSMGLQTAQAQKPHSLFIKADFNSGWKVFDQGLPADVTVSGVTELGGELYLSTDFHGVYKRNAFSNRWVKIGFNLPSQIDINAIQNVGNQLLIGTFQKGIWYSEDRGKTWTKSKSDFFQNPIRAFHFEGMTLWAGTDKGIYQSKNNGKTWEYLLGNKQVLGFAQYKNIVYAALQDGAVKILFGSQKWEYIYTNDALHDIAVLNGTIYNFTLGSGLLKSSDFGKSWHKVQYGIGPNNLYTFEMATQGPYTYVAQWKGVFMSSHNNDMWIQDRSLPSDIAFGLLKTTSKGLVAAAAMR